METINPNQRIVFYDGDCGFCNSSVQFILNNRKVDFYFLPLQSELAKKILSENGITVNMDSIYYFNVSKIYDRSSAALQICKGLKSFYPVLFIFYVIPKFLRDPFYNFIAKRRHKLRAGFCAIPTVEERKYFLK